MMFHKSGRFVPRVVGILAMASLLLLFQWSPAVASATQPLSLAVSGTVLNMGVQTYTLSGGTVVFAQVSNQLVDPATAHLTYTLSSVVDGTTVTGTANFTLTGTTSSGGQAVTASGQILISSMIVGAMIPLGCSTTCNSALPLFFEGGSSLSVNIGGSISTSSPVFDLESPYFNPWGAPIVLTSADGSTVIVTTYTTGTIQWQGTQLGGSLSGSVDGTPVTGAFTIVSNETEDLVAGTASDSGTMSLSGTNPSFLTVSGNYSGSSTIPTSGSADCSLATGIAGTCLETGFQSTGRATMENGQISIVGTYTTAWGVPAIGFQSVLDFAYGYNASDPQVGCPTVRANPDELPSIQINGSSTRVTLNATNTINFQVWHYDAIPAAWLTGSCLGQDTQSFSTLSVSRVAYSIDGGPLVNTIVGDHRNGMIMCQGSGIISEWQACGSSMNVVQTWSGSITFTIPPTGYHTVTIYAWGQNGVGPFTSTVWLYHSLDGFVGPKFQIQLAGSVLNDSAADVPVVVHVTGMIPDWTIHGLKYDPISLTYYTVMPASNELVGSFPSGSHVTATFPTLSKTLDFTMNGRVGSSLKEEVG